MKQFFMLVLMLFLIQLAFTFEISEEEEDAQYQKEMEVILKETAKFRYGNDLKKGDFVEYQKIGSKNDSSLITLSVLQKNDSLLVVEEKFDDTTFYSEYNIITCELEKVWGFDKDDSQEEHVIDLKNRTKDNQLINDIKTRIANGFFIDSFQIENERNIISIGNQSIECIKYKANLQNLLKDVSNDKNEKEKIEDSMSIYMSSNVPKMYPLMHSALQMLINDEMFRSSDQGLVKNCYIELKSYKKGE